MTSHRAQLFFSRSQDASREAWLVADWRLRSSGGEPSGKGRRGRRRGRGRIGHPLAPSSTAGLQRTVGTTRGAHSRTRELDVLHCVLQMSSPGRGTHGRRWKGEPSRSQQTRTQSAPPGHSPPLRIHVHAGAAAPSVSARFQAVHRLQETAHRQKMEQVAEWVSACRMAPTSAEPGAEQMSRAIFAVRRAVTVQVQTSAGGRPLEEALVSSDPKVTRRQIPFLCLQRPVLLMMSGLAPVGVESRITLSRSVLKRKGGQRQLQELCLLSRCASWNTSEPGNNHEPVHTSLAVTLLPTKILYLGPTPWFCAVCCHAAEANPTHKVIEKTKVLESSVSGARKSMKRPSLCLGITSAPCHSFPFDSRAT